MKKLLRQLQVEIDTAYLYREVSRLYHDNLASTVLQKMADIEDKHVSIVLSKIHEQNPDFKQPGPSLRARIQIKLARYFGCDFILGHLASIEHQMSRSVIQKKQAAGENINGLENVHLNIIQSVSENQNRGVGGSVLSTFEGKHRSIGGNELRAAVLGAYDGLVSNMSLVMGVVGASTHQNTVILAGTAGLFAGAFSMGLGEWVSVQSSRELYQRQVEIEAEEIENSPEEELQELALLYQAKGMTEEAALQLATEIFKDKEQALDSLVREELGFDKDELGGSAYKAAFTSFFLFAIGAIIPVLPFFYQGNIPHTIYSLGLSTLGLFFLGAAITLFTGRSALYSGLRQVLFGLGAAGLTYIIGKFIGMSIAG